MGADYFFSQHFEISLNQTRKLSYGASSREIKSHEPDMHYDLKFIRIDVTFQKWPDKRCNGDLEVWEK